MSDSLFPRADAVRLDARMRDIEVRLENLLVGVSRGTLRKTELLNQLSVTTESESARDVAGLIGDVNVETILLSWSPVSDPQLAVYEVQWSAFANFDSPTSRHTSNTFYAIAGVDRSTAYYIRVRALVGTELGRWTPVFSSASGLASYANLQTRSVSNLTRYRFGSSAVIGPDWFECERFRLTTPQTFGDDVRLPGASLCRGSGFFDFARYNPPVPLPLPNSPAPSGGSVGGCIIGPMALDTVGGYVEIAVTVYLRIDITWGGGIRVHLIRDGEVLSEGLDNTAVDSSYTDLFATDQSSEAIISAVFLTDPPPLTGTHIFELAFEPFEGVTGNHGCVAFVKYVDVQLLELRR